MRSSYAALCAAVVLLGALLPTSEPAQAAPSRGVPTAAVTGAAERSGTVVGNGSAASCTSKAVVAAVRRGGHITFDCGPRPVTIVMTSTAKVRNTSRTVVLDGGGSVTLSGGGTRRILYQNTCDPEQVWTTSHCNDQKYPKLVLKRITLVQGNSTGVRAEGGGGGAVFVRGGRLRVVRSTFRDNRCDPTGPDLGGAAIRVLDQYRDRPVKVSGSTFTGGRCSNGGALSSIGVSWRITDSVFRDNRAIGRGANPARRGAPGGGSGGAIYNDGNRMRLVLVRSTVERNRAREGGGAIFFVSNDRTGTLRIDRSRLRENPSAGFESAGYPGIFFLGHGRPVVTRSTLR